MDYSKVKDFLSNRVEQKELDKLQNQPALLFENREGRFGNIYLFKKFGKEEANTLKLSSNITTHYMEDNVSAQDHWAIAPLSYTLSGLVGEVIYSTPIKVTEVKQRDLIDYLKPLTVISPTFDTITQSSINKTNAINASFERYSKIARQIFSDVTNAPLSKPNQQKVIEMLTKLRDNRQLVEVYTPYGTFKNLAIEDISTTQNNSKYVSNLEIKFLQWRNLKTETRKATKEDQAMLAQMMKAPEIQQGIASTQEIKQTTLSRLTGIGDVRRK